MEKKSIENDIQTLSITDDPQTLYEIRTEDNKPSYEDMLAMQEAFSDMGKDLEAKTLTRIQNKVVETIHGVREGDMCMDDVLANLSEIFEMCES